MLTVLVPMLSISDYIKILDVYELCFQQSVQGLSLPSSNTSFSNLTVTSTSVHKTRACLQSGGIHFEDQKIAILHLGTEKCKQK